MTTYTCPDGHTSSAGDYCDVCGAPIGGPPRATGGPMPTGGPVPPGGAVQAPAGMLDLGPGGPPTMPAPTLGAPTDRTCPNCGASNLPGALYCEDCGYDFTTGQLPRPLDPPPGVAAVVAPSTDQLGLPTQSGPADPSPQQVSAPPVTAPPVTPTSAPGHVEWVAEIWVDPDWYASQDVTDPCPSSGLPLVIPVLERTVLVGRTSTSRNIHPQIDVSGDNGVSRRHAQFNSDGQRWWVEDLQSANGTFVGKAGAPLPAAPIPAGQRIELAEDDRVYVGAWTRLVVRRATAEESTLGG